MAIKKLGGKNGNLKCETDGCKKLRYAGTKLCPDCYSKSNDKGFRNSKNRIINAKLQKDLWQATNFASKLIRQGKNYHEAIKISAGYYKVDKSDLRSAMAQRSGLNRKGKRNSN